MGEDDGGERHGLRGDRVRGALEPLVVGERARLLPLEFRLREVPHDDRAVREAADDGGGPRRVEAEGEDVARRL